MLCAVSIVLLAGCGGAAVQVIGTGNASGTGPSSSSKGATGGGSSAGSTGSSSSSGGEAGTGSGNAGTSSSGGSGASSSGSSSSSGGTTAGVTVSITSLQSLVASGASTTLTWSSSNAASCTASGAWSGTQSEQGSASTGAISATETFTLTCSGTGGGSASDSVTVEVEPAGGQAASTCTGSSGTLSLTARVTRASGISPLLVFFDATGTTDSAVGPNTTAFQDVSYTWDFGDAGPSGTAAWGNGSNKGGNRRNVASGAIAAHLYVSDADASFIATVTARSGANTASCQLAVSAYGATGANGFPGAQTTCVSASGTPVAGSGGCPAGAAVLRTSSFNTALSGSSFGSGRRVLFHCGDTFAGDNATLSGTHWSVGAYGGCEGTQTGRPTLSDSGNSGELSVAVNAGDGRIADLDLEGNGRGAYAVETGGGDAIPYQITLYNLRSNGNNSGYAWSQGAQWGLIDSVMTAMRTAIGTYVNFSGNNPGQWTGNPFNNVDYQAILGNLLNGGGGSNNGSGQETMRVSAGRLMVIADNTIENANSVGAVLKIHNGNPSSPSTFSGVYTELIEISDNWFGGSSGSQAIENAPQNGNDDERLRNIVFERNIVATGPGGAGGKLLVSAVNESVRDNVFFTAGGIAPAPFYPVQVAQRGIEPVPRGVEVFNNTCYRSTYCVGLDGEFYHGAPIDSYAENNLYYNVSNSFATVVNRGSANVVAGNSATPAANPGFIDASGSWSVLSDFTPTANVAGAVSVPVWFDALGAVWSTGWNLGAIQD